ncbi:MULTISPECIES: helix-turn-helix transcriptional regulator [unclassified Nitrosomonas]|jgi:DNA-binding transcriptional ArsR family regulator|uniref:ArsR/SmtB family transcription factor n=1 Tax=unclassified Nitrosomonas TaxID=2609265 RepID=UPI001DB41525|nr:MULTISPECIES: metalloregulator ArsR/SmtB family transcription factor [unclassified Nitrosomonas]MBX9893981.1 metalloregulator ArsR/SmtB family transcription factor [Nitrosomonas sp.]WMJ09025.1 metalloregulator ArsR/SmtB family transcription factor [Nitrosomonas sp. sh817]
MKTQPVLNDMAALHASASDACALLKILANEDRLLILCELSRGTRNVGELEEILGIHQPTLSQQLTVLREENLVETERKGKYIYYTLASKEAIKVMETLFDLYCKSACEGVS